MKPIVAHCRRNFLPITETFIENQVFNLKDFDSVVLTRKINDCFVDEKNLKIFNKKSFGLVSFLKKMSRGEVKFFTNVIKQIKPKLLHAHFGSDAWYFLKLKKKMKLLLVVSFYGYDAYRLPKKFFGSGKIILKQVFKNADKIIVPSQHMKDHLIGLGCEERKIETLPWGTNAQRHPEKQSDEGSRYYLHNMRKDRYTRFISIGRMVEKKGQIYLLQAFKEVLDRKIDAELTIIGAGPLKKKLIKTVDKLGISAKVDLIDKLSNDEVVDNLMSRNIYVQPSVAAKNGDQEGIPTAIMEAMACGLPIIATTHSGIPEIVKNNVNGILVPERNIEKLANVMEKLAKNPDLQKEFGNAGRKIVEEKFNIDKQIKKLEEVYSKIL